MKLLVKIQNWPKRGETIPPMRVGGRIWPAVWNDRANAYVFDTPTLADANRCMEDFKKASHIALGVCLEINGVMVSEGEALGPLAERMKPDVTPPESVAMAAGVAPDKSVRHRRQKAE